MNRSIAPLVETTRDFVLIKIPKKLFGGPVSSKKISGLERGLRESLKEAASGKLAGPFKSGKAFLRALKSFPK